MVAIALAIFLLCFVQIVCLGVRILVNREHHQEMMKFQEKFLQIQLKQQAQREAEMILNQSMVEVAMEMKKKELEGK